ncbi:MAG TPA: preprotein translocase subunit SecG [Terriglobales bacterium]|nr:preprotein translocase subunit SecG [Terriglobales bacterium]
MVVLLTILHVIVCFFLIIVVLLQSGKSADIAAAFGGMGSQTAFGPRGAATVLTKATTWAAIIFMITSLSLAIIASKKRAGSILGGTKPAQTQGQTQPSAPPAQNPVQGQPQQNRPVAPQPASK